MGRMQIPAAVAVIVAAAIISCARAKPDYKKEVNQAKAAMEQVARAGTVRIYATNPNSHGKANDLTIELQCPDRMHLVNNGAAQGALEEEILIGSTWYYKLQGRGWWHPKTYRSDVAITCKDVELKWANQLIVDPYGSYQANDAGAWAVNAHPCHKWTLSSKIPFAAPDLVKDVDVCINAEHQLLRFADGKYKWEFYDYGVPVQVDPPPSWTDQ